MLQSAGAFGRLLAAIGILFGTLILEVMLAILLYIFLNTQVPDLFNALVSTAGGALIWVLNSVRGFAPDFAEVASGSLLGDLSAKALFLLFLGLFASGLIRVIIFSFARMRRGRHRHSHSHEHSH